MRAIMLLIAALAGFNATATNATDLHCKNAYTKDDQIYIQVTDLDFKAGTIHTASTTIAIPSGSEDWGIVPEMSAGSYTRKNLTKLPYNGRKYSGHLKFDLIGKGTVKAGNFSPDTADLIVSPEYTVVKTIPQQNNWDKSWTWDVEVRSHSAALAANWSDHHGDYIPLNCFSVAMVNDSKKRP